MPDVKVRVRILLCPHQSLQNAQPSATWPRPAKVAVQLTPTQVGAAGGSSVDLGETSNNGETRLRDLERNVYQVDVLSPHFEATGPLDLMHAGANQTLEVRLVPRDGLALALLQLAQNPAGAGVEGASVHITSSDGSFAETFTSCADGRVYAVAPVGNVTLQFDPLPLADGRRLIASDPHVLHMAEVSDTVEAVPIAYWPAIDVSVKPTVKTAADGTAPLTGTSVTVEYRGSSLAPGSSLTKSLDASSASGVSFEYSIPGIYVVTVIPPPTYMGWPIKTGPQQLTPKSLLSGGSLEQAVEFELAGQAEIDILIKTPQNSQLKESLPLRAYDRDSSVSIPINAPTGPSTATIPEGIPLRIGLAPGSVPMIGQVPLTLVTQNQAVVARPGTNTIELEYAHSIAINAVDEQGHAVPGALIDVFDQRQTPIQTVVTDAQGGFLAGLPSEGTYFLGPHSVGGQVVKRTQVEVHSREQVTVLFALNDRPAKDSGEAITDLSAYPVLTEEVSTTGVPAPSGGGSGSGRPGAGYGHTVDQVMRDVLGWRPSGDVAAFQAALTGAFQLRAVEGHTEWSWQQRGYAVQADMGALTGAQASIYARAKSALDQIQPLLSGLTAINPALYPPQDLEAIRTVVAAELQELVNELALEGGPRIQRVDELFRLLLGESHKSFSLNPDLVQGQLGILRERFGLTVDEIDTVDEERIVTNFRVIVEQILALQASWHTDRELLSGVSSKTALGTLLIWLSRGLEAVVESVGDLTFVLDSVYVDAAQRQVIELRFAGLTVEVPSLPIRGSHNTPITYTFEHHEAPLLLSDLLDWVVRACQDEGPRIVQDAGKDGVFAFEPILDKLRILIHATRKVARHGATLPTGMRTPRVDRALQVLAGQLDEAANFARLVRRDAVPQIASAQFTPLTFTTLATPLTVTLTGSNFRPRASAVLSAEGREDLANLPASVTVNTPSTAIVSFADPRAFATNAGTTWMVSLINDDGTQSYPIEVLRVPRHSGKPA
jgi:hypothetical protein